MSYTKVARPTGTWTAVSKPGTLIPAAEFDVATFDNSRFDITQQYVVDLWVRGELSTAVYLKLSKPTTITTKVAKPTTSWAKGAI